MNINQIVNGTEVELNDMLAARENRVFLQRELLHCFPMTLISFTLNIAGPVKVFPLAIKTYNEGIKLIQHCCKAEGILIENLTEIKEKTGYECFVSVNAAPDRVKIAMMNLEQRYSICRLFDIDVIDKNGNKLSRTEYSCKERECLVCNNPAFLCSSIRAHSLDEILRATCEIMQQHFAEEYSKKLAAIAAKALLQEVLTTPKPGLVDKDNSGSHRDMDILTFETSALALVPWFERFVAYGIEHCGNDAGSYLKDLRPLGIQAEIDMLKATKGVNTHKGVIFSMGILLAALGSFYGNGVAPDIKQLSIRCAEIAGPIKFDFDNLSKKAAITNGEAQFFKSGTTGARGEAIKGFPTLFNIAFPALEKFLKNGENLNDAGAAALLNIMAFAEDTNIAARSSPEKMNEIQCNLKQFLRNEPTVNEILIKSKQMDGEFIAENISAGGSADLLALSFFMYFLSCEVINMEKHIYLL